MKALTLGRTVLTDGALSALNSIKVEPSLLFRRHQLGDWGELLEEDKAKNAQALSSGFGMIFSSYELAEKVKVWVITQSDRAVTTILLPSEY